VKPKTEIKIGQVWREKRPFAHMAWHREVRVTEMAYVQLITNAQQEAKEDARRIDRRVDALVIELTELQRNHTALSSGRRSVKRCAGDRPA
jgi:DNA-binding transcriptional regulator GbsR (MarR family)